MLPVPVPYCPAGQAWHVDTPATGANVPAAQDRHAADVGAPVPVPKVPDGQTVQATALGAFKEVEYVPVPHARQWLTAVMPSPVL